MAGTEESTLVLGEPNITVKVCVSLKRLLIVTFNIKTIRIQSSKCSHPVKLPFGGIINLHICFTISSCYAPISLTLVLTGSNGGSSTLCHICGFDYQQRALKPFPALALCSEDRVI